MVAENDYVFFEAFRKLAFSCLVKVPLLFILYSCLRDVWSRDA